MGCNIYNNTCVLCHSSTHRTVGVCIQDNFKLLKEIRNLKTIVRKYNPYSYLLLCENCLMKLKIFTKCDMRPYQIYGYRSMQESSNENKNNPQYFEDTSCQCEHCKAKYGNLPLLAEVIEKIENKCSSNQNTANKSDEEKDILPKTENEPQQDIPLNFSIKQDISEVISQPSTSKETIAHKKVMNCEHCGKIFTHKGDLNKHLRKHTGEQPFKCSQCNRKFAHTSNLARHLRVHSGVKPFVCERCNKSFSRKDKLIMHQKTKLCLNSAQSSKS